jgi:vancomycin aglycone glucosyltransferase
MRALLSTIGSRGDVQPLVALALELRAVGHEVRMCVPPDFVEWIATYGLSATPIGPELRSTGRAAASRPTPEQRRQMIEGTVATQFDTIAAAARGCDVIVGATMLQVAAPSIAESMRIPYVFAAYCPAVLPSPRQEPPVLPMVDPPPIAAGDYSDFWEQDRWRWKETWGPVVNSHRSSLGLPPIDDVRGHIQTEHPWLAADAALAPWPGPGELLQIGAWILSDERPLPAELAAFLDAGEPPVYFGFGSMRAPEHLGRVMIESARALGRRAIVSRGWAELSVDDAPDCLAIGDVNHQALFPRVAAVVHHGGAGTTTSAARAGAPQVIIPQFYDQPYWAARVRQLGIGQRAAPTTESLSAALQGALALAAPARAFASLLRSDGARIAAERLGSGKLSA